MANYRLEVASRTDVGRVRTTNEDCVAVNANFGIAVVADGMGGHRRGEMASRMATQLVVDRLSRLSAQYRSTQARAPIEHVRHVIEEANRAIFDAARRDSTALGMGTTIATVLFQGDWITLAHVGDSRVYRLRDGRLELLTRDDSLLSDQLERGLIEAHNAGKSHNRHLVTQALGTQHQVSVNLREQFTRPDDIYLLCSDGLNDMVDDEDIELIMDTLSVNLPLAVTHLVQLANDHGGHDNVSAILVKVGEAQTRFALGNWLRRLFTGK